MATIKEVAELANVSVPTVYKVFDENYTTTDEIRKRVLKASKELDYRPRKNRKTYRDSKTIAIIYNEIIYVFLTIFLYLLKCPQSLILSALRAFCFCGKPHISRSIFLYFLYQTWLKSW